MPENIGPVLEEEKRVPFNNAMLEAGKPVYTHNGYLILKLVQLANSDYIAVCDDGTVLRYDCTGMLHNADRNTQRMFHKVMLKSADFYEDDDNEWRVCGSEDHRDRLIRDGTTVRKMWWYA